MSVEFYPVHRVLDIDETCGETDEDDGSKRPRAPEDPVSMTPIKHPAYYITMDNGNKKCFNAKTVRSFGESQVNYLHGSNKKIPNPPHHDFVDLDERLHRSASKGDARELIFLLKMGAKVNEANKEGATTLWIAARKGHLAVVEALLNAGADKNKPHTDGRTPLWIAIGEGHLAVVIALLKAGAEVNEEGQLAVVEALIEDGAEVNEAIRLLHEVLP